LSDPSTHDGTFDETERPFRSRSIASRASKELSAESEFDPAFQDVPDSSKAFGAPERRTSNASFNRGEEDSLKEDTAEIKNIKRVSRQSQESYTRSAKKNLKNWQARLLQLSFLSYLLSEGQLVFRL
jgi:UPF0755 protein